MTTFLELCPDNLELHKSKGVLRYSEPDGQYRLVVDVDQQLADLYLSLIPPCKNVRRPRWGAHITIIRPYRDMPSMWDAWRLYEGEEIEFYYDNYIYNGEVYYWLNVYSVRIEDIRRELGMPVDAKFRQPPPGFKKSFHMTVAHNKGTL